jgi:hypothetical protein
MTLNEIERLLTYQPPRPGEAAAHELLRKQEQIMWEIVQALPIIKPSHESIDAAVLAFGRVIVDVVPEGPDSVAIGHLALARTALHERLLLALRSAPNELASDVPRLTDLAWAELRRARHIASTGIAMRGLRSRDVA